VTPPATVEQVLHAVAADVPVDRRTLASLLHQRPHPDAVTPLLAVAAPETVTAADVELDLVRHAATVAGEAVELTPTEFELLRAMAAEPGRAFSRMELLDAAQGEAYEGYERTIDTHVKNLRNKIEPDPKSPRYIITVYGVGYKFAED